MKIGFFQYGVTARNPEANYSHIAGILQNYQCDLLVLPELFTCGYSFANVSEIMPFAEVLTDSKTVKFLQNLAGHLGGNVSGSIPEFSDGKLYNTAILVNADGLVGQQRKVHLPEYEKQFFTGGDSIATWELPNNAKVGMISCFDCWFPQFGSLLKQNGAQIFCNSSGFGGDVTPAILPTRARENQVFIISCNRIGAEMFGNEVEEFCGKSQIISPDGKILDSAGNKEKLAIVDIDLAEIKHPAFGSLICKNFMLEHKKYQINML